MYAIIKTGGKQYKVAENDVLCVEKIAASEGNEISIDQILMIGTQGEKKVNTHALDKASVTAQVLEQFKDDKVIVFKKKRRHNYRRKKGHRQQLTKIKILKIQEAS